MLLILNLQSADLSNLKICLSRSVQKNYGKSNHNQSEVSPQMYPYQSGFMFPIPSNNMSNMQPPGLTFGPCQLFQQNMYKYAQTQHDFGRQYQG